MNNSNANASEWKPLPDTNVSHRALLTGFLMLVCSAAHVIFSGSSTEKASVQMAAALPQDVAMSSQSVTQDSSQATGTQHERESDWHIMHLTNRHYATLASVSETSELNYLCMEGISCGWLVNLKDETGCNKNTKGQEFRVRLNANKVTRDFNSRCAGYGLIYLGIEPGDSAIISDMVASTDELHINSVGAAAIFRTQYYNSYGASEAMNRAIVSAGL